MKTGKGKRTIRKQTYESNHKYVDNIEYKKCLECDEWFPMIEEYYYKNKSNKIDGFNPYCKECTKQRSSKYQKDNKEWTVAYSKKQYKRKPQYFKDAAKQWSIENEEQKKKNQSDWQRNNPEKIKQYNNERELHKKHDITKEEWIKCKEYFNCSCAYCGISEEVAKTIYKQKLHKDHADPNGANDISNCIPACRSCNSSKHNSLLSEWFNVNNNYTIERENKINKWLNGEYLTSKNLI